MNVQMVPNQPCKAQISKYFHSQEPNTNIFEATALMETLTSAGESQNIKQAKNNFSSTV